MPTLLRIGLELGANNTDSNIVRTLRFGAASRLNQAGQQILGRALTPAYRSGTYPAWERVRKHC